jgi:hypothetical protein
MDGFDVVKKSPNPFSNLVAVVLYKASHITNMLQLMQRNLLFVNNKNAPVPDTVNPNFAFSIILCTFLWSRPNAHKDSVSQIVHCSVFYTILGDLHNNIKSGFYCNCIMVPFSKQY